MFNSKRQLKVAIVGDRIGKKGLIKAYQQNGYPEQTIVDGKEYKLDMRNAAGPIERSRGEIYMNCACYLLCYSVINRKSFENLKQTWWREILKYTKAPIILVATDVVDRIPSYSGNYVTDVEAKCFCDEIDAFFLLKLSGKMKNDFDTMLKQIVCAVEMVRSK